MKIINFGSLNIDYVYRVPHIVCPGETISGRGLEKFCGGKGMNQSIAAARAGAKICHAGCIGKDGDLLKHELQKAGAETALIQQKNVATGHAIIQVSDSGQNSIVLFGGANLSIDDSQIKQVFSSAEAGDILLLQNEINCLPEIFQAGINAGMKICLNPAPFTEDIKELSLYKLSILVVNETEGKQLTGKSSNEEIIESMTSSYPDTEIILTLGKDGAAYAHGPVRYFAECVDVPVIDTTGAGDTFVGYFLAGICCGMPADKNLSRACLAASIAVSRHGATAAIPEISEVEKFEQNNRAVNATTA